jgi:hypothetical protein
MRKITTPKIYKNDLILDIGLLKVVQTMQLF